ncbi:AAA family ATPase [Kitasatospora aburaviensis]
MAAPLAAAGGRTGRGHRRAAACPGRRAGPYPGAAAFEAVDAERFFGREALLDRLVGLLDERRLVVVTGPSGVGKSSLVRAGLLARLAGGRPPASGASGRPAVGRRGTDHRVAACRGAGPRRRVGARRARRPQARAGIGRGTGAAGTVPVALLTPGSARWRRTPWRWPGSGSEPGRRGAGAAAGRRG